VATFESHPFGTLMLAFFVLGTAYINRKGK
jgi:hypothetical protein